MSLEENKSSGFITFTLRTADDYLVTLRYPYDKLYFFKDKCNICNNLTNNKYAEVTTFDLSAFRYDSFSIILRYLETNKPPILSSDLDPDDLYKLALYLGLDDNILYHLNFNSEDRFFSSLADFDKKMVEDEFKLRQLLYSNEDKDYTKDDKNYEINKVIAELKLPEIQKSKYSNIHQIQKLNDYYYGISAVLYNIGNIRIRLGDAIRNKKIISSELIPKIKYPAVMNPHIIDVINFIIYQLLNGFTYDNFVVAGGFIYHHDTYTQTTNNTTDLDLFITTKDYKKAIIAIRNIYKTVVAVNKMIPHQTRKVLISINQNALNFLITVSINSIRTYTVNIQVILRLYNSIAQVISGFDIDSCCIAYNGIFYTMPRFIRSQIYNYNIVDPERQSTTYSQRLTKYVQRGVDIAMPGLNPDYINCNFMDKSSKYTGLAKIITYCNTHHFGKSDKTNQLSDYEFSPFVLNFEGMYRTIRRGVIGNYYNKYIKDKEIKTSDEYDELKKYGYYDSNDNPNELIVSMSINGDNKDLYKYAIDNNIALPIKISYDLDFILDSGKNTNLSDKSINKILGNDNILTTLNSSLPSKLEFKTKNAGTQLTNSFNPTTEDWYKDLYFK